MKKDKTLLVLLAIAAFAFLAFKPKLKGSIYIPPLDKGEFVPDDENNKFVNKTF